MQQDDLFLHDAESRITRGLPGTELMQWANLRREQLPPDVRRQLGSRLRSLAGADPCKRAAYLAICEGLEEHSGAGGSKLSA